MIELILALITTCSVVQCIVDEKTSPPTISICDRNVADHNAAQPDFLVNNKEGVAVLVIRRKSCHNI